MNKVIRALVVDDHPLFAKATKAILQEIEYVEVIGTAGNGKDCLDLVRIHQPELVFLDYYLPDQLGSQVARMIKSEFPQTHIVIFTGVEVSKIFNKLIEAGVSGVISKGSSESTIKNMVNCIIDNHAAVPLSFFHKMRIVEEETSKHLELTHDEVQIMNLLVGGSTHEQIGEQIHLSKRTVDNYLKRIYDKMGIKTRAQAVEQFVKSDYYQESDGRV
jgi:two-component system, NarL family, competent response regulator ComA